MTLDAALSEALRAAGLAPANVAWIGVAPISGLATGEGAIAANVASMPSAGTAFDAVVMRATSSDVLGELRVARARVRAGGVLALVVPIAREGVRSLAQRALSSLDSNRRPRALDEVCAATLSVGASPVRVVDLAGLSGEALVYGVVRESVLD